MADISFTFHSIDPLGRVHPIDPQKIPMGHKQALSALLGRETTQQIFRRVISFPNQETVFHLALPHDGSTLFLSRNVQEGEEMVWKDFLNASPIPRPQSHWPLSVSHSLNQARDLYKRARLYYKVDAIVRKALFEMPREEEVETQQEVEAPPMPRIHHADFMMEQRRILPYHHYHAMSLSAHIRHLESWQRLFQGDEGEEVTLEKWAFTLADCLSNLLDLYFYALRALWVYHFPPEELP